MDELTLSTDNGSVFLLLLSGANIDVDNGRVALKPPFDMLL